VARVLVGLQLLTRQSSFLANSPIKISRTNRKREGREVKGLGWREKQKGKVRGEIRGGDVHPHLRLSELNLSSIIWQKHMLRGKQTQRATH